MNDEQLRIQIQLLHQNDKNAFEIIYNELKTPIFTIIIRIVQSPELAEDILQELFIKLYQSPPNPTLSKLRAYIFQMARNLAIDTYRRQKNNINIDDFEESLISEIDFTQKLFIDDALLKLSIEERQIVILHINGQLKFREIADIMLIPLGTVLWKYRKAINQLRILLGGVQ